MITPGAGDHRPPEWLVKAQSLLKLLTLSSSRSNSCSGLSGWELATRVQTWPLSSLVWRIVWYKEALLALQTPASPVSSLTAGLFHYQLPIMSSSIFPRKMPYGSRTTLTIHLFILLILHSLRLVRLGKSGLKVSRIILGCMSYGKYVRLLDVRAMN